MASYIRVRTEGIGSQTGYLIYFSSVRNINGDLGVDTFDLSLPQSISRLLTPTTGKKDDINLQVMFIDDGSNKCISFDNVGNQTNMGLTTAPEQLQFLRDYIISNKINSSYDLYLEYLDDGGGIVGVKQGFAKASYNVEGESSFSYFVATITFKVGGNPFSAL